MANPTVTPYIFAGAPAVPTVANFNTYNTNMVAVLAPEVVTASAAASAAASAWTAVPLVGGPSGSAGDGVSGVVASSIYTVNWGGLYAVSYRVEWTASTIGQRRAAIKYVSGGVTTWIMDTANTFGSAGPAFFPDGTTTTTDPIQFAAGVILLPGDTLELYVWQSTAGSLAYSATFIAGWLNN